MEKHICYNEKEFKESIDKIYDKLDDVADSLAMISQQLNGEGRTNMNLDYIKKRVMPEINQIVHLLNNFDINDKKHDLDIDEKRKGLEELMKQVLY